MKIVTVCITLLLLVAMFVWRDVFITSAYISNGYQQVVIVPPRGAPQRVWVKSLTVEMFR